MTNATMKSENKYRKLLIELFEYSDIDGNKKMDRKEFTEFMIASTLVHAYHKLEKDRVILNSGDR